MSRNQLGIVLLTTFLVFCTLYTPQPLLPQLATEFGVAMTDAALLITVTLIPLGLAPVFYGYFLQAIPARTLLRIALAFLILDQLALFFATEFWQLIALRGLQGLLMPALFTSLMTYCASMAQSDKVRSTMGLYIAATIVGGFASRILSGYLSLHFGWQWVFLILAVLLILPLILTSRIDADAEINFSRLDARAIGRVLRVPTYAYCYLALFTVFFVFTGILATLPFRVEEIAPGTGSFIISLVYLGYMIGVPMAIYSDRLQKWVGSEKKLLLAGLGITEIGLFGYLPPNLIMLFVFMLILAGGMFLIHSTLSGFLNDIASEHKGVVNGLYVSVYYISGTIGSWLPTLLYQQLGWRWMMWIFFAVICLSCWCLLQLPHRDRAAATV